MARREKCTETVPLHLGGALRQKLDGLGILTPAGSDPVSLVIERIEDPAKAPVCGAYWRIWDIAEQLILPKIAHLLPPRLGWGYGTHSAKNAIFRVPNGLDPLYALGAGVPFGCVTLAQNCTRTDSRVALNEYANTPGAHCEWLAEAAAAPNPDANSFFSNRHVLGVADIGLLAGEEFCFAIDYRVPAGCAVNSAQAIVRIDTDNGPIGYNIGGMDETGLNPLNFLSLDDTKDEAFTLVTNWIRMPKALSGSQLLCIPMAMWRESALGGRPAKVAMSNPRILLRREWAQPC